MSVLRTFWYLALGVSWKIDGQKIKIKTHTHTNVHWANCTMCYKDEAKSLCQGPDLTWRSGKVLLSKCFGAQILRTSRRL